MPAGSRELCVSPFSTGFTSSVCSEVPLFPYFYIFLSFELLTICFHFSWKVVIKMSCWAPTCCYNATCSLFLESLPEVGRVASFGGYFGSLCSATVFTECIEVSFCCMAESCHGTNTNLGPFVDMCMCIRTYIRHAVLMGIVPWLQAMIQMQLFVSKRSINNRA